MARLKSRQMSIPGGYFFVQPEISYDSRKTLGAQPSFNRLTDSVIATRKGNPHYVTKHNWSTDFENVSNEVEAFSVRVCQNMGWTNYISDDGGVTEFPKYLPQSRQSQGEVSAVAAKTKAIWAGVKTLNDWIDSGEPAVASEESERRAARCVACPLNGEGGLEKWFTRPASEGIRRQFEKLESRKLVTSHDATLNICKACFCPMRLKVHTPWKFIKPQLSDAVITDLRGGNNCWIIEAVDSGT